MTQQLQKRQNGQIVYIPATYLGVNNDPAPATVVGITLGVVLGVAFVSGSFIFTDAMGGAFDNIIEGSTADVEIAPQGANDFGSVMIEENVVSAAGTTHRTSAEELVHLIRSLGKTAVQRDTLYREVKVWS